MTSAPRKKDLHGHEPLWADSANQTVRTRSVLGTEVCDVAIVGAGVSGALCAAVLSAAGHDIVVVDRRLPATGSTLASTAMIQFEIDTPLRDLADKIGAKRAERAFLRSFQAVGDLGKLIAHHSMRCAWKDRTAVYLTGSKMGRRAMAMEADYRIKIGLPSEYIDATKLRERFGFERTGAIVSQGAAELNPVQLTAECLRTAQKNGARVYSPHEVKDIQASSRTVVLETSTGQTITARRVVFATGYETLKQIPADAYDIISTWAIATQPIPAARFWPHRSLVWEAADPYIYMRATQDNRIVVGGEDAAFDNPKKRDRLIGAKSKSLLAKVRDLLRDDRLEMDYAWAGSFADSPAGLPFIAEVDGLPNCVAVLGSGGNGITFSMVAAQFCKHWAAGTGDPDGDLFRPS